jgi:lipid-binding SYLF domain-containing protein
MKRHLVLILGCATLVGNLAWAASEGDAAAERLKNAAQVLQQISATPDKGIPEEVVAHAKCIVVIPNLVKAGLVVGGKYGRGVAVCRTDAGNGTSAKGGKPAANSKWSAPAFITIGGGSLGPQIGAEGVDLVMMVMSDKGVQEELLSTKVEFTLEGSVAAGPVGRHASVGSDWKQDAAVLTYSQTKGAFAGQTLEGAVIEQDKDATKAVYGNDVAFEKVLRGHVSAPSSAAPFLQEVSQLSREAAAQEAREQVPDRQKKN